MRAALISILALTALGATEAQAGDLIYRGKSLPGNEPSWQMYARLTPDGPGRYRARIEATNESCLPAIEGVVSRRGPVATLTSDGCRLDMRFAGRALSIRETSCQMRHGANCSYDAELRQKK